MTQLAFALSHNPSYAAADFCVSECNAQAHAWIMRWPDWPMHALLLIGPKGSGKTHLAQVWQARANAGVWQFGKSPDVIGHTLVDLDTGIADEQALFHLLNSVREKKLSLVITAATAPREWNIQLPDLRSRLLSLPLAELQAPDDKVLAAALAKQFADRQLEVSPEVQRYILTRVERSFAAVQMWAEQLDNAALKRQKAITLKLVKEMLS